MYFSTLSEWLNWISTLHPSDIELGLTRIKIVASRLGILSPTCPVICVGGTNGKGSTIASLDAIYRAALYNVGTFTSPVLFRHNEYVTINGKHPDDHAFCLAFEKIESARENISLTPFEFYTLAALLLFQKQSLDIILLEVGLGGRLDAVNIIDADIAIVTSIDIDHQDWLGSTREKIALEKAGIFRSGQLAIYGDFSPPQTLLHYANQLNTILFCQGKEFNFQKEPQSWIWSYNKVTYTKLPCTSIALQNMSIALMAIELLQSQLPVHRQALDQGLMQINLPGRIQVLSGNITKILDVSHNPAAVTFLANQLKRMPCQGKTYAVFSMLVDKDIVGSIKAINTMISNWFCAPLSVKRGATQQELMQAFQQAGVDKVSFFSTIKEAFQAAEIKANINDRIIVFGSFHTVASTWKLVWNI
ncbi:MAG: hypothetical protein A3F42_08605 [Gammaproteobacteria bacterium RIFCSPHIGHO2_12_FULL_37_34]|nr:MAG: hypothetical protein A3F42_08605 [Gammaproteobacteria bacterium RIFCSPHIGHO2_12_FULL_37_34]